MAISAAIGILIALTRSASAAPPLVDPTVDDPATPWQITADTIDHDRKRQQYTAAGHVVIEKSGRRITADRVLFDQAASQVTAVGSVTVTAGKDRITGERVSFNLKTETGEIIDGRLYLDETHMYVSGDRITKTGPDTYAVEGASATQCDGPDPDWRITARHLNITIEGYGTARHAAFWARSLPIAYTPYAVFPVKSKRQSGLLLPTVDLSSRNGFTYQQPLYWAINPQSDATFNWHHLQFRGEKFGAEYRYRIGEASQGLLMADGLLDKQIDDGSAEATGQWGFDGDDYTRENKDRYWLRGRQDQELPWGIQAQLDLDVVSDPDYLREFNNGPTGYPETDLRFESDFGRGLDDPGSIERLNRLQLGKTTARTQTTMGVDWIDNVVLRRSEASDTTLQRLPTLAHSLRRTEIGESGVDLSGTADYVHFFRQSGERGHRIDFQPRLAYPMQWGNYMAVEPSIGGRSTFWHLDTTAETNVESGRTYSRGIYDVGATANTEVFRVYGQNRTDGWRIRHAIIPEVRYSHIPAQDQNQFPYFDAEDRIAPQNQVTYGITQTLTTRQQAAPDPDAKPGDPPPASAYRELARLTVSQTYDIRKVDNDEPEPYSWVSFFGELHPLSYLSLRADGDWSTYADRWERHSELVEFQSPRGDRIYLEHRYERDHHQSIIGEGRIRLFGGLSVIGSHEYDALEREDIKSEIGFEYQQQCWSVTATYTDDIQDRRYAVVFRLTGLAGQASPPENRRPLQSP